MKQKNYSSINIKKNLISLVQLSHLQPIILPIFGIFLTLIIPMVTSYKRSCHNHMIIIHKKNIIIAKLAYKAFCGFLPRNEKPLLLKFDLWKIKKQVAIHRNN